MQKIIIGLIATYISFHTYADNVKDIMVRNKNDGSINISIKGQKNIELESINGSDSNLNFIIQKRINNKDYVLISYNTQGVSYQDNRVYYEKYNFFYAYDCTSKCIYDSKLSDFFGFGGNVLSSENDKILFNYIYSDKKNVLKDLESDFFKKWYSGNLKMGKVIYKTFISSTSNYDPDAKSYLVKGDEFQIKDISSRWLNILYKSSKGKIIEGWIQCKDTNICREN